MLLVRKVGSVCGRKCKGEYCSVHNTVMNGRETEPRACVGCGRGTFREVGVCSRCTVGGNYSSASYARKIDKLAHLLDVDVELIRTHLIKIE